MTDFTGRSDPNTAETPGRAAGAPSRRASRVDPAARRGPVDGQGGPTRSSRVDHGRALAESVLNRSEWLSPSDRQLLRSIYADGHPVARLAPMLHVGKRSLRRRIERLLERVNSRRFAYVAARHARWPSTRRRIAASMVLEGRSLRETAESMGMSLYNVRRHYEAINALFEASEKPGL